MLSGTSILVATLALLGGGFCQVQSNVNFVDPVQYYLSLMKSAFNKLEEDSWCRLTIPDFMQTVNQDVYGLAVLGNVTYKNGFMMSVQQVRLQETSGVNQLWTHNTATGVTLGTLRSEVEMMEVMFGFDVRLDLDDGSHRNFTAAFTYERILLTLALSKAMQTKTLSATATVDTMAAPNRRVQYLPHDDQSQLLSRQMGNAMQGAGWTIWDAIDDWLEDRLAPAMVELATTTYQLPEVCYHCPMTGQIW